MATRVIRKYANRRLYDPQESRHLTLDEVRQIVVDGERVRVEDAKTGEDLTRSVFLQIMMILALAIMVGCPQHCSSG